VSKFVLVEAISQFRQRYVIEVPDNHADVTEDTFGCTAVQWAEDTVTMEEMKEFSQLWLGETITSSRELTKEDIISLCDTDNDYCKSWTEEQKMNAFVTEIGYKRDY
jgi:hypothetical protein